MVKTTQYFKVLGGQGYDDKIVVARLCTIYGLSVCTINILAHVMGFYNYAWSVVGT